MDTLKAEHKRVAPLRLGTILAILYGLLGLIVAPIFLIAGLAGGGMHDAGGLPVGGLLLGVAGAVFVPIGYALAGFLTGLVSAALYNFVVRWTGGVQFEFVHVPPGN